MTSLGSDSGSYITDDNGLPIKHKYSKIGGCSICLQGKQPVVNWSELLPPPPENLPSVSELGSPMDYSGESTFQCHINNHNNNNSCMIDPRYTDSLVSSLSKLSACSCPIPHDSVFPHQHAKIPYSDFDYPTHPGLSHRYHDLAGIYQDGSGPSCGSAHNSDRPYSPKLPSLLRSQHADSLLHRCPSPRSCHSCNNSVQPSSGLQIMPSSSSSASSYGSNYHHLAHQPLHTGMFGSANQSSSGAENYNDSKVKASSQMCGMHPQGQVSSAFTQTGQGGQVSYNGSYPYTPVALHGYRMPSMEPEHPRNSCEFDQFTGQVHPSGITDHEGSQMFCPTRDVLVAQFRGG
ncbi:unnamed protein product [Candidula unifasciata]|uniref:Uncharacterized protein n=1 Tax=Candidula unifasciata TaxID=100452 RepID=A0A8S3ZZ64_9EUPU|nr:unnamed protein product [Candidula unifasciata]